MTGDPKKLTSVDERRLLRRIDPPTPAEMEAIAVCPALTAVYRLMINTMEERLGVRMKDKAIAAHLEMDPAQFSRIINHGTAAFSWDAERELMRFCGSGAPIWWRLYQVGMDPTTVELRETEYERQIRELREEIRRKNNELEALTRIVRSERGAADGDGSQ